MNVFSTLNIMEHYNDSFLEPNAKTHISRRYIIHFEYDRISKISLQCMKVIFHMIDGIIKNSTHPYANILKE